MRPSAGKTPVETPVVEVGALRPGPRGGFILYGSRPGHAVAGPGRPPSAFKRMMAELATLPGIEDTLRRILTGEQAIRMRDGVMLVDGRLWLDAYKYICDRAYGKSVSEAELAREQPGPRKLLVQFVDESGRGRREVGGS